MKKFIQILLFFLFRFLYEPKRLILEKIKRMHPIFYMIYSFLAPMFFTSSGLIILYFWHNLFSDYIILTLFGLAGPIGVILSTLGYYFLGEIIYYIVIPLCIIKSVFFLVMFIIILFSSSDY